MPDFLSRLASNRDAILLGEIAGLLHMVGKCSSAFIKAQASDGGSQDPHQKLEQIPALSARLPHSRLTTAFAFTVGEKQECLANDFTDFIVKYKNREGNGPDSFLLKLFNFCHRMTSADEKGVVREKQPRDGTTIATPFGHVVQTVDLTQIDRDRAEIDSALAAALDEFLAERCDISTLRAKAIEILQPRLVRALGETRRPANDVTLWAQSHGVASLYKSQLATVAMGLGPKPGADLNMLTWRLLGIGWNGLSFLQKAHRPGDVLARATILQRVAAGCRRLVEVEYPLGNLFYSDLDGIFVTFPGIDDQCAVRLLRELGSRLTQEVREPSGGELWPVFTLSAASRTLTSVTEEIQTRAHLTRATTSPMVSLARVAGKRETYDISAVPPLLPPRPGEDICPVCQSRSKPVRDDACSVCKERREQRQNGWQADRRGRTIWIDEVADEHNRVALLTLRFDLERWLDGTWLTSLFSQTYDAWLEPSNWPRIKRNAQFGGKLGAIASHPAPVAAYAESLLKEVATGDVTRDTGFKTAVLNTFFKDVQAAEARGLDNYIEPFLRNLARRIDDTPGFQPSAQDLARAIFTQNASPARLERIWEETDDFVKTWSNKLSETLAGEGQRLGFALSSPVPGLQPGRTYRLTVEGLAPGPVVVLCQGTGDSPLLTVDSPTKFRFGNASGIAALQRALRGGGVSSIVDEGAGREVLRPRPPLRADPSSFRPEPYLPLIVLTHSPVYCQVLLPADQVVGALGALLTLYHNRFAKVEGKLPLHVGLLVANRMFPLYALIEAGQRMLNAPTFQTGRVQRPWWEVETSAVDPYYASYPTVPPEPWGFELGGLVVPTGVEQLWLTPGYFDFDFLGSTADRHRLRYGEDNAGAPVRDTVAYGYLQPRPMPLHRLSQLLDVHRVLQRLTPTKRRQLEEALLTKLEEWRLLGTEAAEVYRLFANATLSRVFEGSWMALAPSERKLVEQSAHDGLLLDAIELFQHVLKEDAFDG